MARRKIRKMFVVEEKFVEDEEEVVTGRVGRNRNRTWRSHSRRLLVLTWHLLSFCLSLSAPPPPQPPLFLFLSHVRHAPPQTCTHWRWAASAYYRGLCQNTAWKMRGGGRGSCPSTAFWRDAASSRSYRQQLFTLSCHRLRLPTTTHGWILPLPTFLFQLACARASYFGCLLKLELLLPSSRLPALLPSLRLISLINFPLLDFAKNRRQKIHLGIRTVSPFFLLSVKMYRTSFIFFSCNYFRLA